MSSLPYETTGEVSLSTIVASLFSWIRRNVLWLLLGAFVGAIGSYFYNEAKPKEYSSSLIGYGNNIDDLRVREILQPLQALRSMNELPELARRLQMTEAEVKQITGISAQTNNTLEADLPPFPPRENTVFFFSITASTHNPELFPKIQKGIVAYIDQEPNVQSRLQELRQSTQRRIEQEKEEIAYLNRVKAMMLEGKLSSDVLDIGSTSRHIMDITEKLEDNTLFLQRLKHEIVVTRGMEINRKPSSPGKYRALAFGAALGFILVLALMGIRALVRYSKTV